MELEESTFLTSGYTQSYSHQDSMVLAQKQKYRPVNKIENPEINPCTYGYLIFFTNEARTYNGAKTASSITGARKTGQLRVKE